MASMQVQSLIFSKDKFSRAQAVKWAKDHDFSHGGVDETEGSYRLRQQDPGKFKTMRTVSMTEGVKAVVGKSTEQPVAAAQPEDILKALSPDDDPTEVLAQVMDDNDGYIGGTIRQGSMASGSEFGSDYTAEGARRSGEIPHERFSFGDMTFDVDTAKELCDGKPNDEVVVDPSWSYKINVDRVAAMNSKSTNPVLIAQIPTTKGLMPLLIDGHHRLYKAAMENVEVLPAYVMTPEETLFCLDTHPDLMTTLTQNLRDITDKNKVAKSSTLDHVADIWHRIIEKAQPGAGDVHVPATEPQKKKPEDDEDDAGGQTTNAANDDPGAAQTPGWDTPPENNEEVKMLKKRVKKALLATETDGVKKSQSGIMVCLYIPSEVGDQIALPGGEPADELHVTLAYVPGVGADQVVFDAIVKCLTDVARQFAPVGGKIGGSGLFNASEGSDGKDVYYASFNSPVLPSLLQAVRGALEWGGVSVAMGHGFTPHVTLNYVEPGEGSLGSVKSDNFRVPAISVASRTIPRVDIPFSGTRVMKQSKYVGAEQIRAAGADLITMPKSIKGNSCANCLWVDMEKAFCNHPDVQLELVDGPEHMCCNEWSTPGTIHQGTGAVVQDDELLAEQVLISVEKEDQDAVVVPIAKLYGPQHVVSGVILEPDTEDAQGDIMSAEEIEKTAHEYLEKYRAVGRRHRGIIKAFPVESYVAPVDMQVDDGVYGPVTITKGSWVVAVKVVDPAEWAKVESGEYKAFSVGGVGVRD